MLANPEGRLLDFAKRMQHNNQARLAIGADRTSSRPIPREKWQPTNVELKFRPHAAHITLYLLISVTLATQFVHNLQLPLQTPLLESSSIQQQEELSCLTCIRGVSSAGVDLTRRCEGYYCGPYQFSYQYWAEAGKPGNSQGVRDYEKCARDKQCAESTVRAYFKKFKRDCNNDGLVDCLDMAALHKGGPQSCQLDWFYRSRYWQAFNKTTCVTERDPAVQKSNLAKKGQASASQNRQSQIVMKNQTLTSECLDCICEALTSCGSHSLGASNCGSGTVCGPFAISQSYWKDGRRPGVSWTACARTKECSSMTIRNYMDKYKRDCTGDGFVTCEDYAAIHRRGPNSCMNRDLLKEQYWTRFLACRANQRPINDANLVKVNEDDASSGSLASRGDSTVQASNSQQTSPSSSPSVAATPPTMAPNLLQAMTSRLSNQIQNRYEISTQSVSSSTAQPPTLASTFELSPVLIETKQSTSNSQFKTYQTAKPTTAALMTMTTLQQHSYGSHDDQQPHDRFTPVHTHSVSAHEISVPKSTSISSPSSSSNLYTKPSQTTRVYSEPHLTQQSRPIIDYSSLPTIIVSKPLGSVSTNRISQAPLSPQHQYSSPSYVSHTEYSQTPTQTQTSLGTTTTTSPPVSPSSFAPPVTSFPSSELDLSISGSDSPLSSQQVPGFSLDDQGGKEYGVSDLESNSGPTVSSFDRVVNDIVGDPNFSRAQPPVPELDQQRKQTQSTPTQQSPGPASSSVSVSQSTLSTMLNDQLSSLSTPAMSSNKRENSKTLSPNIYSVSGDSSSAHHPDAASILTGPDALNMTSLFEKGGLNETNRIASECLDCICDASSNCDTTVQCISKQREKNRCGMYMISWNQYKESDISLTTIMSASSTSARQNDDYDEKLYYECSTDKNCAEKLIHLYIEKHSKDCNQDGKIDCYDVAAIHRVGPDNCNSHKFLASQYWRDFHHCYATDRMTTTIQPRA